MSIAIQSGASDFDFFMGEWRVSHRRLNERLAGCAEWTEFGGSCSVQKILGGLGNIDDNIVELPGGAYRAATLRAFNRKTTQWSIWWLDARSPEQIDTPVVGAFAEGIGLFYADDVLNGTPIKVRFMWSVPSPDEPRWEQAFSTDGGANWETNWFMTFHRAVGSQ